MPIQLSFFVTEVEIEGIAYRHITDLGVTFCCLKLAGGFRVVGSSIFEKPEQYNIEDGRRYALKDAVLNLHHDKAYLEHVQKLKRASGSEEDEPLPVLFPARVDAPSSLPVTPTEAPSEPTEAPSEPTEAPSKGSFAHGTPETGPLPEPCPEEPKVIGYAQTGFLEFPSKTAPQRSVTVEFPVKEALK